MTTVINVKEYIPDKRSYFNIRRFKVGRFKIERPTKVIDAKNTSKRVFENYEQNFGIKIFESTLYVKEKMIDNILTERDEELIKRHFNFKSWFRDYGFVVPITLQFNPLKYGIEKVKGYLRYAYEYSKPFVFVPNIRIEKTIKIGSRNRKVGIISLREYIVFVDEIVEFLDNKNDKPIFAPISLRFGVNELRRLIDHYLKKEYKCLWFDFEGTSVSETKIARIKVVLDEVEKRRELDNIVIYATNVRREIVSNYKDPKSPASDVLTSLVGVDILGSNREPQRPMEPKDKAPIDEKELLKHKARLLDRRSYYYFKVTELLKEDRLKEIYLRKAFNVLENTKRIDEEFRDQSEFLLENGSVKDYITAKQMLREYKNGELLSSLLLPEVDLSGWY